MPPTTYRSDIDGLRAIAVISVMLYHLKFGVTGGFLGVDVFFVISGYLIAKIIYDETTAGTFSILSFYERRARRILPALIFTIVCSSVAAAATDYPRELTEFAKSSIAAALFCANIYFYATSDYFAAAANTIPLLHLWSLGVEEQFYFIFPLLILAMAGRFRKYLGLTLGICFLVSLAASQHRLSIDPPGAFYLIQYRGFELLVGCILALPEVRKHAGRFSTVSSIAGLCLLLLSLFFFDDHLPFPGLNALVPTLATALIIASGTHETLVSKLLSPMAPIGRISYSLYLAHWPVLVFSTKLFPIASPTTFAAINIVVSFLIASISFYFIERPFRHRRPLQSAARVAVVSIVCLAITVSVAVVTIAMSGFERDMSLPVSRMVSFMTYDHRQPFREGECFLTPAQGFNDLKLSSCIPEQRPLAMLWGDSHAAHLFVGLKESFTAAGYNLGMLSASSCPPIIGLDLPWRPQCRDFNDRVLEQIISRRPSIVVLSALWDFSQPSHERSLSLLDTTLDKLRSSGIAVVVIGNSPVYKMSVPRMLADRLLSSTHIRLASVADEEGYPRISDVVLAARLRNRPGVQFVSIFKGICATDCAVSLLDQTPIYYDASHFTEAGSRYVAEQIVPSILTGN